MIFDEEVAITEAIETMAAMGLLEAEYLEQPSGRVGWSSRLLKYLRVCCWVRY